MADDFFSLELGDSYIRVCDGNINKGAITLDALAMDYKPITFFTNQNEKTLDELAWLIKNVVNSLKIQKKSVSVIIPDTYTYSQIMTMPYLKEKELLSAIKYQADQFIPLPLEEATLDLDIIYEDKTNNKLLILIVAASQNLIDVTSRVVEKAGLVAEKIENEVSATAKLISTIYQNQIQKQATVFINLGYYGTSLYFYHPQLNLVNNLYSFKSGLDLFSREVQVNFNLDKLKADSALKSIGFAKEGSLDLAGVLRPVFDEFSSEIERFIYSIKEKEKISTINQLITFNLANRINYFDKSLETRLGIKTIKFDLSQLIKKNNNLAIYSQYPSEFISVIGGNIR